MAQIGFFGALQKIYAAVGTTADAVGTLADAAGNLATAANNVSQVAALKSEVYLKETKLVDEANLKEVELKLNARLAAITANPTLLTAPASEPAAA